MPRSLPRTGRNGRGAQDVNPASRWAVSRAKIRHREKPGKVAKPSRIGYVLFLFALTRRHLGTLDGEHNIMEKSVFQRIKPFYRGLANGLILAIIYYEFIADKCS